MPRMGLTYVEDPLYRYSSSGMVHPQTARLMLMAAHTRLCASHTRLLPSCHVAIHGHIC
jgi:hypothetical protein